MVEVSSSAKAIELVSCDLSTQRVRKEKLPPRIVETFGASRPLASFLAYDRIPVGSHALAEKNHIFISPGLLGETTAIVTRSPLKYGLSVSIMGPPFGNLLLKARIPVLDIWGIAKEPSVLVITEKRVEFHDASILWGATIEDARAMLCDQFPGYDVLLIGPAGEKALRIAVAVHGRRQLGEDGLGAVLGSKNLKAVLVEGNLRSVPLDIEDDLLLNDAFLSPSGRSSLIANNYSALSAEPYPGVWPAALSPTGWAFLGPNLGIYDQEEILTAGNYCFEQGISLRFVGAALGVFASLVEKGRVTGYDVRFGSTSLYNLIKFMQNGKGIVHQMTFGPESLVALRGETSPTVKGEVGLGIHPGASMGYALNFAVTNSIRTIIPMMEFLALPLESKPKSWSNKAQLLCWAEEFLGGCDVLGLPMHSVLTSFRKWPLSRAFMSILPGLFLNRGFSIPDSIVSSLNETGVSFSFQDLLVLGARATILERLYGTREGLTGSDDRLPPIFLTAKPPVAFPSAILSRQKFFRAKGAYYRLRGLLPSGLPSLETLKKLRLETVIAL